MARAIETTPVNVGSFELTDTFQDVKGWLETQVEGVRMTYYLLAHADDGVIWGRVDNGELTTSSDPNFSPMLRVETLQTARLFSKTSEIFLWRDGDGVFQARWISDGDGDQMKYYDEDQILWGNRIEAFEGSFTRMSDGAQGLQHIVPIGVANADGDHRPLRLTVRHYLSEDQFGLLRVVCSRLVNVFVK